MENIEMIPVNWIEPHPDNPRKDLGDLTELTESIRHNGIYQNLTIVPKTEPIKTSVDEELAIISINEEKDPRLKEFKQKEKEHGRRVPGGYVVIIGHRRLAAAKKAGLTRVPCAIAYMSMQKQIETMILENMQRADLTIYEQVKGFQQLLDLGDSVEGIAKKTGFTEKTVRRRTEIGRLDPDKLERIMKGRGKQLTLEDFDKLAKIDDVETRNRLLEEIGTRNFEYVVAAAKAAQETKKMLPAVMDWIQSLKHKTEKVSESAAYQYETLMPYPGIEIKKWKTEKGMAEVALEKLPPTKKLFYCITEGGYLRLYQKGLTAVQAPKKTEEEIYMSLCTFKPDIMKEYIADDEKMIKRNLIDMNYYIIKRRNQIKYKKQDGFNLREYKKKNNNVDFSKDKEPLTERIYYRNVDGKNNSFLVTTNKHFNYSKFDFVKAVKNLHNEITNLNL